VIWKEDLFCWKLLWWLCFCDECTKGDFYLLFNNYFGFIRF